VSLRILADEHIDGDVGSGLLRRGADVEYERVQDFGLTGAPDPLILEWAAANRFIVLTHDRKTMPTFVLERIRGNLEMPGAFIVPKLMPIGALINELSNLAECSEMSDWNGQLVYLPFFR
jgi:hypothetical protein